MQRISAVPRLACAAICAQVLATAVLWAGQIQPQDRILQQIDEGQVASLRGNLHPMARAEFDRGRLNPSMELTGVALTFKLSDGQQAALNRLLAEQQDPASPNYHRWLTPEQYAAQFGMSPGDLDRVTSWLQSQGFTDIRMSRGHTRVSFTGTVARVEAALHTELHNYEVNGETHFANASEPALPAAIAGTVLAVEHLNSFFPKPRAHVMPASARFTSSQSGNHFLSPGDFATIYDITPLYAAGLDGSGITIAVTGQSEIHISDINTFRSLSGLSVNPPVIRQVPGTGTSMVCPGDVDEASLDVEWSGGVAKNATILYVYAGVGTTSCTSPTRPNAFDALFDAIDNNLAPVISISYGNCEANIGSSNAMAAQQEMQRGNSQGQTITAASGDAGAADCEGSSSTVATTGLAVDIPGAVPEVTSVGGSEFTGDAASTSTTAFWSGASGSDNVDSAISYIPEMAWNDSPVTGTGSQLSTTLSATGGGASTMFPKPSWQTGTGVPADAHRDVPDITVSASPNHDGYLVCSQGSCVNGFRRANGNMNAFGGTSVSSQAFAGIVAILNQATNSSLGLGNVNPTLYSLAASTPLAFHDIPSGSSNIVPCTQGSTGCPAAAPFQIGFSTTAGYDRVTGLGSVDVDKLARAWPGFSLPTGFVVSGSAVTVASPGGSGTSTITVTSVSGFSGTVMLSCALNPPSTTAEVSCGFTAPTAGATTPVMLNSSTTSATATLNVSTIAAHAITSTSADAGKHSRSGWLATSSGILAVGIFLIGVPSRRRWTGLAGLLFCVFLAAGVGCGGGSSSSAGGNSQTNPGTPTGSYAVTVTATSGNISHTSNVAVTVQ